MKVVAPPEAESFVREHGGRLYVWTDRTRCCGSAMTFLRSAWAKPARDHDFQEFASGGFSLYLDTGRLEPPDELHLEVKGWHRKRVDAFWNGCAYVDEPVVSMSPRSKNA